MVYSLQKTKFENCSTCKWNIWISNVRNIWVQNIYFFVVRRINKKFTVDVGSVHLIYFNSIDGIFLCCLPFPYLVVSTFGILDNAIDFTWVFVVVGEIWKMNVTYSFLCVWRTHFVSLRYKNFILMPGNDTKCRTFFYVLKMTENWISVLLERPSLSVQ